MPVIDISVGFLHLWLTTLYRSLTQRCVMSV